MEVNEVKEIIISFLELWSSDLQDEFVGALLEPPTTRQASKRLKELRIERALIERQLISQKALLRLYKHSREHEDEMDKFLRELRSQDQ